MTKRFFLLVTSALLALAAIASSQPWLSVSMSPNGKTVELASIDGFALHSWLAVGLGFVALVALMSVYVAKSVRLTLLALSTIGCASASVVIALSSTTRNTSTVQSKIDNAVNIASAHDIAVSDIDFNWSVFSNTWVLLGLLAIWLVLASFKSTGWQTTTRTERPSSKKATKQKADDPISLWESQR